MQLTRKYVVSVVKKQTVKVMKCLNGHDICILEISLIKNTEKIYALMLLFFDSEANHIRSFIKIPFINKGHK